MTIPTQRAILTWQRPANAENSEGTRKRHAVAEIKRDGEQTSFRYFNDDDAAAARKEGFVDYPGIPIKFSHFGDAALRILAHRLMPRNREDFDGFLEKFALPTDETHDDLTLLARTGGRLTRDGFAICETFDGFDEPFSYVFDVAGYRHHRDECLDMDDKEPVIFEREPDNEYDPGAVRIVRKKDGTTVGYVNRLQSAKVGQWLDEGEISASVYRINGRVVYPRLFVLANIVPVAESRGLAIDVR